MIRDSLTRFRTALAAVFLGALMGLPAMPAQALGYTYDGPYRGHYYYGPGYHYRPYNYYGYRYRAYPRYRYRVYPRYRYYRYPRYRVPVYPYQYGPYRY